MNGYSALNSIREMRFIQVIANRQANIAIIAVASSRGAWEGKGREIDPPNALDCIKLRSRSVAACGYGEIKWSAENNKTLIILYCLILDPTDQTAENKLFYFIVLNLMA